MAISDKRRLAEKAAESDPAPQRASSPAPRGSPLTASQRTAYLQLLARLQSRLGQGPVPMLVIAGASRGPAASRVARGLEQAARSSGLRTIVTELGGVASRPTLSLKSPGSRGLPGAGSAGDPIGAAPPGSALALADDDCSEAPLELAGALPALIERWFAHASGSLDLVLIEAPSLDSSLAGALLAKACDGLVIAVEEAVTPGQSLCQAVDLARATGCPLLGLVMSGTRRRLPAWRRRFAAAKAERREAE